MIFLNIVVICGLVVFGNVEGTPYEVEGRIHNGKPVELNIYPFMAVIHSLWNNRICGGTILNQNWVLTSARCGTRIGDMVSYGVRNLDERHKFLTSIDQILVHPEYNPMTLANDIVLVRTRSAIKLGKNVQPVSLSNKITGNADFFQILGWGQVKSGGPNSNELQFKNVTAVEIDICREELPSEIIDEKTQICTYGTRGGGGACTGDQGGPLIAYPSLEQVGIMSWGGDCGSGLPTVSTRVEPYLEWIQSNIKN